MSETVSREEFNNLLSELRELRAGHSNQNSGQLSSVHIEKDPPPTHGLGLKPTKLPHFDGTRSNYPSWRTAVLDIFRMDWNTFGYDDSRAFVLIYGALKSTALKKVGSFYEAGGIRGTRKPEDFIEFLDKLYLDPLRVVRANRELQAMKMRDGQRWPEFFAEWSNKLTEARGDFWDDANKISMLWNALNGDLILALAGNTQLPNNDFNKWIGMVNQVAQQLEMADTWVKQNRSTHQKRRDYGFVNKNENYVSDDPRRIEDGPNNNVGQLDPSGDTIMGGINAMGLLRKERQRAKWKNQDQLDRLRRERKCFRCERVGCSSKKCPLLPARNPNKRHTQVNSMNLPDIDPSVIESLTENVAEEVVEDSEN